jgi:hypothetical protein
VLLATLPGGIALLLPGPKPKPEQAAAGYGEPAGRSVASR